MEREKNITKKPVCYFIINLIIIIIIFSIWDKEKMPTRRQQQRHCPCLCHEFIFELFIRTSPHIATAQSYHSPVRISAQLTSHHLPVKSQPAQVHPMSIEFRKPQIKKREYYHPRLCCCHSALFAYLLLLPPRDGGAGVR